MLKFESLTFSKAWLLLAHLTIISVLHVGVLWAKECTQVDLCSCKFDDGTMVDISSLGNTDNTPRFKDVLAKSEGNYYSYNPCKPFTENTCTDAAVCILNNDQTQSVQIGDASKAGFKYDPVGNNVIAAYSSGDLRQLRLSEIVLVCDENANSPDITADGQKDSFFQMTLKTVCACPDGCTASGPTGKYGGGLSGGTVFVIAVLSVLILYIVVGVVVQKVVRKKTGTEVIPNFIFWKSIPILVKDGFMFLIGMCFPRFKPVKYDDIN